MKRWRELSPASRLTMAVVVTGFFFAMGLITTGWLWTGNLVCLLGSAIVLGHAWRAFANRGRR